MIPVLWTQYMYRFGTWAKGGANSLKIAKLVPTSLKEPAGACKKAPIYLLLLNYKKIRTKAAGERVRGPEF
jgi:hypothetical protein